MENELLEKFSDNEKIVLFNLVLELAKEKKTTFESQIGTVINAFLVKKKNDEFDMTPKEEYKQEPFDFSMEPSDEYKQEPFEFDMTPSDEYKQEPFEFDMTPSDEYKQEPFDFSMEPSKKDDSKSTGDYDGPLLEPIDTQKVDYNNGISF